MRSHFKPHIEEMRRYQTSSNRDIENGYRLDRNERVANMDHGLMTEFLSSLPDHILNVTPDIAPLYNKLAEFHNIGKEQIYVTQGITECINFLFATLCSPRENVIVLDPTYPMYSIYAEMYQVEYRKFTYNKEHDADWDTLYDQIDNKTTMVMIANPNLPIESSFTRKEIEKVLEHCSKRGIVVVIDEAYHYFGTDTVYDLTLKYDNLVVLRTFSKAWGLPAIRLGYAISHPDNINYLSKTRSLVETNAISMEAALFALNRPSIIDDHVNEAKAGCSLLKTELQKLGLEWHGGNFTNGLMIFLQNGTDSAELVKFMREKKIYIRGAFEPPYDSCVRVSLGHPEQMQPFVDTLKEWLETKHHSERNTS
ncbi:pyridoxal phosphate-dependent aminotransferase [Kiloniella sp.]|uniref:pyridoxal phosphate-dependent aminotransferase n=1 Tax=Kiloniella sp. TaxID=1938587 RepID=UPI003A95907B